MAFFNFKKRTPKQADTSKLMLKADILFSEVVRLAAADNDGVVSCITCNEPFHYTKVECGHYVKRRHMATRYELKNCGPQCHTCNCHFDGKEEEHAAYIDRTYGDGTALQLSFLANVEHKFMSHELQQMINELKVELKALKQEKFGLTQTRE